MCGARYESCPSRQALRRDVTRIWSLLEEAGVVSMRLAHAVLTSLCFLLCSGVGRVVKERRSGGGEDTLAGFARAQQSATPSLRRISHSTPALCAPCASVRIVVVVGWYFVETGSAWRSHLAKAGSAERQTTPPTPARPCQCRAQIQQRAAREEDSTGGRKAGTHTSSLRAGSVQLLVGQSAIPDTWHRWRLTRSHARRSARRLPLQLTSPRAGDVRSVCSSSMPRRE